MADPFGDAREDFRVEMHKIVAFVFQSVANAAGVDDAKDRKAELSRIWEIAGDDVNKLIDDNWPTDAV